MAVELIPAVLAATVPQLKHRLDVANRLSPIIHLDIMDGRFVRAKSVKLPTSTHLIWPSLVELHAMVTSPAALWPWLDITTPRRVYVHAELGTTLRPFIALLRSRRIEIGLAINPSTSLAALRPYASFVKSILVMSVRPGRYQAAFVPVTLARLRRLHRLWPRHTLACDGSMNPRTVGPVIQAGATRIIVGSDVMLKPNPLGEWKKLRVLTR